MNLFYIDKTTGTFADELLASGFVQLLQQLFAQQGILSPNIVQTDNGYAYEIVCDTPLDLNAVAEAKRPYYPAVIIQTNKNKDKLPAELPSHALIHYETERDQRKQFFEARNALKKTTEKAETTSEENGNLTALPPAPHPDWDIFRMINPAALIGYNSLMEQWFAVISAGLQGQVYTGLCQLFSQSPNDVETIRQEWQTLAKEQNWKLVDATASQFYNPSQGKGINKAQPDGVGLGNLKSFWLLEWLKAVGFYEIAFTRTMQGVSDRKTYVPIYGRMAPKFAKEVYQDFKSRMFSETAVRSDILVVLRYLQAFLEKSKLAQAEGEEERERREMFGEEYTPADFMHGFQVAFYKDLGNAVTTMNLSFLNLPSWVQIHQEDDVQTYREILQEHETIVRQFAENKGDELSLLTQYRDFIVADNLDPFYEFTTAYGSWLISQGEKPGFPPRKFSTHNLRRLLVSTQPQLSKILESPGFINIAYAIRQSTVVAQYRKKEGDRRYDVRYGLGRDLVRQSQYPDEFIAALSDFLHKYNAENAQVMETRSGPYRRSVQTGDIQDILQLIDKHGSDLIAKLLVAYGYAREPRKEENDQETNS
ncbi:MAG: hypothetical protein H6657_25140 [Ardenticatenaceae bacterium]|nr:hypothetical protein [Ardenticatenaceae bacterium]